MQGYTRYAVLVAGALASLYLVTTVAGAQHTQPARENTSSLSANSSLSELSQHGVVASAVLENDPRLNVRMSLKKRRKPITEILHEISSLTHVKLKAEGNEVILANISCVYKKTSLRDILDSLASVRNWEWERRNNILVLHERPNTHLLDLFRPHSQAELQLSEKGKDLLSKLGKQSPALQQAITNLAQNGVNFGELPAEVQQSVRDLLRVGLQVQNAYGRSSTLSPDNLDATSISVQWHTQEGFSDYAVNIFDGHESLGLSFRIFSDPRDNYLVEHPSMASTVWYGAQEDETSRKEGLTTDSRLNQKITLDVHSETVMDALFQLASVVPLNYAAEAPAFVSARKRSFVLKDVPLKDVLDRLAALYGYTWGYKQSGVFLFHTAPEKPTSEQSSATQTP